MRLVIAGAFAACALYGASAIAQNAQTMQPIGQPLPEGEGRDIVATACAQCHGLSALTIRRDGAKGWRRHIENMVVRGAQLNDREIDTAVDYLTTNFGPGQNLLPGKLVMLPVGPGKAEVEAACAVCHDLERVAGARRGKAEWDGIVDDMLDRFGNSDPRLAKQITAYLTQHYGAAPATGGSRNTGKGNPSR
jgi:cytochrome c5